MCQSSISLRFVCLFLVPAPLAFGLLSTAPSWSFSLVTVPLVFLLGVPLDRGTRPSVDTGYAKATAEVP